LNTSFGFIYIRERKRIPPDDYFRGEEIFLISSFFILLLFELNWIHNSLDFSLKEFIITYSGLFVVVLILNSTQSEKERARKEHDTTRRISTRGRVRIRTGKRDRVPRAPVDKKFQIVHRGGKETIFKEQKRERSGD